MNSLDSREPGLTDDAVSKHDHARSATVARSVFALLAYALAASTLVMIFIMAAWRQEAASAFRYVGF